MVGPSPAPMVKAYQIAQETEEAAKVAKEMVYGTTSKPVYKVEQAKSKANPPRAHIPKAKDTPQGKLDQPFSKGSCGKCGKKNHASKNCPHITDVCHYCEKRDTCTQFACLNESRTP